MRIVKVITMTPDELLKFTEEVITKSTRQIREQMQPDLEVMTVRDFARQIKKRRELVLHAVRDGQIPAKRQGKNWAILPADGYAWAKRNGYVP